MVWPLGKVVVNAKRPTNNLYFEVPRVGRVIRTTTFVNALSRLIYTETE